MDSWEEIKLRWSVYSFAADNNLIAGDGRLLTEHFDEINIKESIKQKEQEIKYLEEKLKEKND